MMQDGTLQPDKRALSTFLLRSILISLGLDYNSSLDLRESPEPSASPENGI